MRTHNQRLEVVLGEGVAKKIAYTYQNAPRRNQYFLV